MRLVGQAQQAGFAHVRVEVVDFEPLQRLGFIADLQRLVWACDQQEAQIVVFVGRIVAERGDRVNIDIDQRDVGLQRPKREPLHTRFFARFTQSNRLGVGIPIGVAAEL